MEQPFDVTQGKRLRKQIVIGLIYLFIFAGLGTGVYVSFFQPSPTCFDRKQNQGETEVDCGGPNCAPCERKTWKPLEIGAAQAFPSLSDTVDLVAQLKNPNPRYGAERVSYTFIAKLKTGEERKKSGVAELFPLEERQIFEPALRLSSGQAVRDIESVQFQIDRVDWERLDNFARPDVALVTQTLQNGEQPEVTGRIVNRSSFAIRELFVTVLLLDVSGNPIGVSSTVLENLLPNDEESFRVFWARPFPAGVKNVNVFLHPKLFQDALFQSRFGTSDRFSTQQ